VRSKALVLTVAGALWSLPAAAATATLAVSRPVTVQLETASGDVVVKVEASRQVRVTVKDDVDRVALELHGDRVEATFDGRHRLSSGTVHLEVPRGTRVELSTISGDVRIDGLGGEVRCRSLSGDVHIDGASAADVQTISGDVRIRGTPGPLRIKTVSGDGQVGVVPGPAAQLEFESTSGDLVWSGGCGAHCRITAATVSGDLSFRLDPRSSFELRYQTHSGDLDDHLGLAGAAVGSRGLERPARYGGGDGVIDCRTFSGDLSLERR
jgi:DUF4097 and DUF4098 domain-containing protein YvlB